MSISLGIGACAISAVFFGSMFVPIKNFDAGDGIFFQWVMSSAILLVGYLVFAIQGFPGFYPLAMLGGVFWAVGNVTAVPIISRIGMALGILIWNTTNCLTGWAGGRFGLFGMKANPPSSAILNYMGLVCVIIGGFIFSQVRSNTGPKKNNKKIIVEEPSSEHEKMALNISEPTEDSEEVHSDDVQVAEPKVDSVGRLQGLLLALVAGVFYGMTFVPVIYMIDNPDKYPNQPTEGLAYVFSHYSGIFLTCTAIFLVYALFKKNKPIINPKIVMPSFLSGLLWAIAQASFFVANENLSQTVTFPIITMLPGCIASAWSILFFKEITGRRNFTIMAVAMSITLVGAILVGLSKAIEF